MRFLQNLKECFSFCFNELLPMFIAMLASIALVVGIIGVILFSIERPAHASINPTQAVTAILGEAENQGTKGIEMLAWSLKNRGYLQGVYGMNSKRKHLWPQWLKAKALKAWNKAGHGEDPTFGAQYWGTDADVEIWKTEPWFKNVEHTVSYKDHNWYREIKS